MPGKDPAFLFYSLNWLQGTASLKPEEKGVYVDLLSHQHQSGSLPNDPSRLCRMVGLSEKEFAPIWLTIRSKFVNRPDNRLVNLKLEEVMTERLTKRTTTDHTKAILSRYAVLSRGLRKIAPWILEKIKKEFNVADYEHFSIQEATDRLNKWFTEQITKWSTARSPTRVEDINKDQERIDEDIGGTGEIGEGREGIPVWTGMPGIEQLGLELPELKAASVRLLMDLAGVKATQEQVLQLWEVFKVQNFTGKNWYGSEDDTYSHFINWSKSQKINGTGKEHGGGNTKLGTSESRTDAIRNWGRS